MPCHQDRRRSGRWPRATSGSRRSHCDRTWGSRAGRERRTPKSAGARLLSAVSGIQPRTREASHLRSRRDVVWFGPPVCGSGGVLPDSKHRSTSAVKQNCPQVIRTEPGADEGPCQTAEHEVHHFYRCPPGHPRLGATSGRIYHTVTFDGQNSCRHRSLQVPPDGRSPGAPTPTTGSTNRGGAPAVRPAPTSRSRSPDPTAGAGCQSRMTSPLDGSKKWTRAVSTTRLIGSPIRARDRGLTLAT